MTTPLFSVVIPTHERPELLARAVESVLNQTVGDLECIVVDDAGREPASPPDDPRVRLTRRSANGGPAAARNTGLDLAHGRYLAFLDDDELYTPERLALALPGLEHADVSLCWRKTGDETQVGRYLEGQAGTEILEGPIPHLGVTTARRAVVQRFDERLRACEDVEWWFRMAPNVTVTTVPVYACVCEQRPVDSEGAGARARARLEILEWHTDLLAEHPRAAAYQWKRLGGQAALGGDRQLARTAFRRSFRHRPSLVGFGHVVRSTISLSSRVPHAGTRAPVQSAHLPSRQSNDPTSPHR